MVVPSACACATVKTVKLAALSQSTDITCKFRSSNASIMNESLKTDVG